MTWFQLRRNGQAFWLVEIADAWTGKDDIEVDFGEGAGWRTRHCSNTQPDILPRPAADSAVNACGPQRTAARLTSPFAAAHCSLHVWGRYAAGTRRRSGEASVVTTGIGPACFRYVSRAAGDAIMTLNSAR